jgi:hypothetical protein
MEYDKVVVDYESVHKTVVAKHLVGEDSWIAVADFGLLKPDKWASEITGRGQSADEAISSYNEQYVINLQKRLSRLQK